MCVLELHEDCIYLLDIFEFVISFERGIQKKPRFSALGMISQSRAMMVDDWSISDIRQGFYMFTAVQCIYCFDQVLNQRSLCFTWNKRTNTLLNYFL